MMACFSELERESDGDEPSVSVVGNGSGEHQEKEALTTPLKRKAKPERRKGEEDELQGQLGSQQKLQRNQRGGKPGTGKHAEEGWKKCSACKKFRPEAEYYQCQSSCSQCSLTLKSMRRVAAGQGNAQWLRELEVKDPDGFNKLLKEYARERDTRAKRCRTNFSFTAYRESYIARAGTRTEHVGEMMWRGEYIEFAKGAKLGYLTEQEASLRWDEMLTDKTLKRDEDGPRGNIRLWIKTKDQIIGYTDAAKQRQVEQEEKMTKRAKPEQIQNKLDQVFHGDEAAPGLLSSADLVQRVWQGSTTNSEAGIGGSFGDGLMHTDLRDTLEMSQVSWCVQCCL